MSTLADSVRFGSIRPASTTTAAARSRVDHEPWIAALCCWIAYGMLGVWLADRYGSLIDSLARVANAQYVLFSRDPHPAALGFIWNPLPSVLALPLVALKAIWPVLTGRGVAINFVSAFFGGVAVFFFLRLLRRLSLPVGLRWALSFLFALNPGIAFYAANGMTDLMMAATMLAAIDGLWGYLDDGRASNLLASSSWLAVGFLMRYEVAFWAAVMAAALAFSLARSPAHEATSHTQREQIGGLLIIWLAPLIGVATIWLFVNWMIMGDPLHFARSVYSNATLVQEYEAKATEVGGMTGGAAWLGGAAGHPLAAALYAARHMLLFPPVIVGIIGLLSFGLLGRRQAHTKALLLVAATLGVPLMQVLLLYQGASAGWARFFLGFVPFGFVLAVYGAHLLAARGARAMVWTGCLLTLAVSNVATLPILPMVGASSLFLVEKPSTFTDEDRIVDYMNAHRDLSVLADSFLAFPIIVRLQQPQQFVIPSDRDFPSSLNNPIGRIDAVLVPQPVYVGGLDSVNRQYPLLWAGGEPWARLIREFPGTTRWRLYAVVDPNTVAAPAPTPIETPTPIAPIAPAIPSNTPTPPPAAPTTVPTIPPTARPRTAAAVRQQVVDAEAALRSGSFEVVADYGGGPRSVTTVRFALGDGAQPSRLHVATTYQGSTGTRTAERITIGDRTWQRQPDGRWLVGPTRDSVLDQVRQFLPQIGAATNLAPTSDGAAGVLRWYDLGRQADLTLTIDPTTDLPRQLRQEMRGNSLVVTVTYSGWNTPVAIAPPN